MVSNQGLAEESACDVFGGSGGAKGIETGAKMVQRVVGAGWWEGFGEGEKVWVWCWKCVIGCVYPVVGHSCS